MRAWGIFRIGQTENIPGAAQRLEDKRGEEGVVQILNGVLPHRNKKIATLSAQGGGMVRMSGAFVDECDRMSNRTM